MGRGDAGAGRIITAANASTDDNPAHSSGRWSFRRLAAVCALILVATLVGVFVIISGGDGHRYTILFQNAGQLVPGNKVYIGGVPVGTVNEIALDDQSNAKVQVTVEQELHEGTSATIRATSLPGIANRYISVSPGPNNSPALGEGATIGLADSESPVELDSLFNAFKPKVRGGLRDFVKGNAAIYSGKGPQANQTYRYFSTGLGSARRWMEELGRDQQLFEQFVVNSSKLVTAIGQRGDHLSSSIARSRTTFGAIAKETESLDLALEKLPPTFRQGSTTFSNLRAALDDIDPLVATAKPATKNLAPFLRDVRPVVKRSVPVFSNLGLTLNRDNKPKVKANDAAEILRGLPKTHRRAATAFPAGIGAIRDFQPTLDFARPYMPDIMQSLAKLGQVSGYYDANGHYFRVLPTASNLFDWNSGTNVLDPIPVADQFAQFGAPDVFVRCPGSATQSATDNSNPFVGPTWPDSGLDATDCNPADVPPGP